MKKHELKSTAAWRPLSIVSGNFQASRGPATGRLIINADDWGMDRSTTDRTVDCILSGSVSSVSAMVLMEDSERAASIAREQAVDVGLHLNLTTPFSAGNCPLRIHEEQRKIARYLLRHRLARVMFHPGLASAFDYVAKWQIEEFMRLYGRAPSRFDGHHHMHLCANVLVQRLLPENTTVRRNFSFHAGEKSVWNRFYRACMDRVLARRHRLTDYFFSLPPLQPENRLERIFSLAFEWVVEVETHPVNRAEYHFLTQGDFAHFVEHIRSEPLRVR